MKKKIASIIAMSVIATNSIPAVNVFANEVVKEKAVAIENQVSKNMTVNDFKIKNNPNFNKYNELYKVGVKSITNNGGNYSSSQINKAIDGNLNTHWETGKPNSDTFKNEVMFEFDDMAQINRLAYATRQDSAKGKGYPTSAEIYVSSEDKGDNFELAGKVNKSKVTGDMVEFKFDTVNAKRVKFVFTEANQNWASGSEFWFYKEDKILDKMEKLFTDSNMNIVSEEFNSLDKIKLLEEECKNHPLYNDFKENLENAKTIVTQGKIESSIATTKMFNFLDNEEYIKQFRIPYSNIKNISNNAGHYGSQNIEKAIDKDVSTYWETNKSNTGNWSNEITVEFVKPITIDKIVYGARQSDTKGFIEEFEIYGSNTSKGDTFQLVSTGKANRDKGLVEVKFKPTTFKRIKLKAVKGNQNWATLNEIMFFKQDELTDKLNSIFTDQTQSELKQEYNSKEAIDALDKEVKTHPLNAELSKIIERARKVLDNKFEGNVLKMTLPQNGNVQGHCRNDLLMSSFGTDFISTGVLAKPGEIIEVYVDADGSKPLPQIMFSQAQGHYGNWQRKYNLKPGYNKFEVPTIYDEKWSHKTNKGGAIYFINPYTTAQQGRAPKIILEGGQKFPLYNQGDDEQDFLKELKDYSDYVKANPDTAVDIFEYNSPRILFTGRASDANQVYNVEKVNVGESTLAWSKVVDDMLKFAGLEENSKDPKHDSTGIRTDIRVMQPYGGAYAAGDHIGIQYHIADDFLRTDKRSMDGIRWGTVHELGHQLDIIPRTWGEVSNNMWSNEEFMRAGIKDNVNYGPIYDRVSSDVDTNYKYEDFDLFARLGMFWQLRLAKDDFWQSLERMYRERKPKAETYQEKCDLFAEYSSELIGANLTEYITRYGMTLSDECKAKLNKYPQLDKKIWYLNGDAMKYNGKGFNNDVKVEVSSKLDKSAKTNTLNFNIDKDNSGDLLGYEVSKDGKVLGFTKLNTFVVKNVDVNENVKYDVVAYAKDLSKAKATSIKAFKPFIKTVGGVTLGLNEKFNPLDYVKATDYEGNELGDIKVISNVDNTKKGSYTVTYEVNSNDVVATKTMKVDVVSKYDYLSDKEWKSAETQYGAPRRNKDIKGRTLGEPKNYDKGIGIHANGNVVYDLGENNYDNFEVKVGVDMNIAPQNNSSISFKIIGDGKTLATTKVLKHEDDLAYINVPIKGVKELKIEVNNGGNGNTSDHGIIVEPKLTTNNSKPTLEIPNSQSVKVGETLENIVGDYKAIDSEDGDLTNKVLVTGQDKVDFNRVGKYQLVYSVIDSDGNKVEKTRSINVINMEDFKYLSDYEWKSAQTSWSSVKKDKAVSDNKLRLTDENGKEVVYDKGIGTHANSTIVYDLDGKNCDFFSSYVGVDRAMYNTVGSVEFEVYLDGTKVYDSGLMNSKDPQKYVEVNIAGAKELKLVAKDGGNGIGSDHATWGDAKLYYVNADKLK
ncbi:MAG: NPCBM/NEW2 domain-containing protein [Terrisporobacter sp.]